MCSAPFAFRMDFPVIPAESVIFAPPGNDGLVLSRFQQLHQSYRCVRQSRATARH